MINVLMGTHYGFNIQYQILPNGLVTWVAERGSVLIGGTDREDMWIAEMRRRIRQATGRS